MLCSGLFTAFDFYHLNLGFGNKIVTDLSWTQMTILLVVLWFAIDNMLPENDFEGLKTTEKSDKSNKKTVKKMKGYIKSAPP